MTGKVFSMHTMNANAGGEVVGNRTRRGGTAVNEFERDRLTEGKGMQLMLCEDGGIQEAVRGTGVEESLYRDRRLPRNQELDEESQVTGEGGGKERGGNRTAQPSSYWLGRSFFGTSEVGVLN